GLPAASGVLSDPFFGKLDDFRQTQPSFLFCRGHRGPHHHNFQKINLTPPPRHKGHNPGSHDDADMAFATLFAPRLVDGPGTACYVMPRLLLIEIGNNSRFTAW